MSTRSALLWFYSVSCVFVVMLRSDMYMYIKIIIINATSKLMLQYVHNQDNIYYRQTISSLLSDVCALEEEHCRSNLLLHNFAVYNYP